MERESRNKIKETYNLSDIIKATEKNNKAKEGFETLHRAGVNITDWDARRAFCIGI